MTKIYKLISISIFLQFTIGVNAQVATNYTFTQTTNAYSPLTGGSIVGGPLNDEEVFQGLPIGFQFKFNGMCYNEFGIGTNGYIEFGAGTIIDDYNMISVGVDNNIVAVLNSDLQLGSNITATTVIGSPVVLIETSMGLSIGDTINSGYGFPAGTIITALSATSFTASTNAITVISGGEILFLNGEMRYQTIGTAPNRTLVVQWKNARNFGSLDGRNDNFNIQLRIEETTNKISIIYGSFFCGGNPSAITYEVGLRGITTSDFNSRTNPTNWATTIASSVNTDACAMDALLIPSSGLTFNWSSSIQPSDPIITATSSNTMLCSGQSATLSVTGANSYTWSTSSNSTSIVVNPTTTSNYTVSGTDANNCSNTTTFTQSVSICTDVNSISTIGNSTINVFPNPTNDLLTVHLSALSEHMHFEIYSNLGQFIVSEKIINTSFSINLENYTCGIYSLRLIEDGVATFKANIIKQ